MKFSGLACGLAMMVAGPALAATVQGGYGVSTTGYVVAAQVSTSALSATTVDVGAPLRDSSAATKAYVDAAVAAAGGGGRPVYVGATSVTYTGNLGGPAGADAKCQAQYPGSRMMASSDVIRADYSAVSPTQAGWIWCDQVSWGTYSNYSRMWCRDIVTSLAFGWNSGLYNSYPNCMNYTSVAASSASNYYAGFIMNANRTLSEMNCNTAGQYIQCVRD